MDDCGAIKDNQTEEKEAGGGIVYPEGLKWTRQRKMVYGVLWAAKEPLTAIQIYHLAVKCSQGEEYAVSTVYRILGAFEERGLVEKNNWPGEGTVVYTLKRGDHTHYAVCLECHRRIPLKHCPFSHMKLEKETGDFTVTGHKLELYGYCKTCQENRNM